mgnify:CR=1 FL=1
MAQNDVIAQVRGLNVDFGEGKSFPHVVKDVSSPFAAARPWGLWGSPVPANP